MAKTRSIYTCQQCGHQSPKWLGKCPDCGQWNSLVEEAAPKVLKGAPARLAQPGAAAAPERLRDVSATEEERQSTGIGELDRALGGGIVAGSLTLIGGDPGIGKSTLLLQAMQHLAAQGTVLYVTAEESARQVKLRANRLGQDEGELFLLAETCLERVLERVRQLTPAVLVIDSIQTIFTGEIESAPGSVSQVRECAGRLMLQAKRDGLPTFLVGHVTKDGAIAGPRVLEHMVDTVLYFEGDPGHAFRLLRTVKNRFGSTNEIGVFEMSDRGLTEVDNPSELFLAERPTGEAGSAVVPAIEGTRPILVEIQALVSGSSLGTPRRTTMGIDHNRASLLVAVLEKKAGINVQGQDIFLNVAGGVRLSEPAADLGILAAVASSQLNRPIPPSICIFGEVGLTGEVRAVARADLRIQEAARLGFRQCLVPQGNLRHLQPPPGLELRGVSHTAEALETLFDRGLRRSE